jgi:hypothetical protein
VNSATDCALAVLAGLVLELGHAVEPAHPGGAVEQPLQLGMGGHLRLVEQHRAVGIDPAGDQRRDHLQRGGRSSAGSCGIEIACRSARKNRHSPPCFGLQRILHRHPVADRAEIIAEVEVARWAGCRKRRA